MSTILKALQRLEDEKRANTERSLDEQVVARRSAPAPERRGLKIGAFAIGGLAVVAAAFYFWSHREEPDPEVVMESPPPAAAPAAEATAQVAAEKPRRKRSARPAPAARAQRDPSEVEVSPVVEVVKRLDAAPADSDAPAASTERDAPRSRAGAERPTRRSSARKPRARVAREAAEPIPDPQQVASAEPPATRNLANSVPAKPDSTSPAPVEIAAVAAVPAPAAAPASIPAAIREPEKKVVQRANLPALSIEKTIWHPDAHRRVAVVKLIDAEEVLRLKEGDAVGPLVVITINPSSVLFNHDGVEIHYHVGG